MAKPSIDIAESLARLSAATIFELRGEWRRLTRPTATKSSNFGSRRRFAWSAQKSCRSEAFSF
jgi:hypothetical protein